MGFGGPYGVYHAVYDNFRWMERFGDPEFLYHAAAARLWGLMAMRLASAEVVPLRFADYGETLRSQLDVLRREAIRRARVPGVSAPPTLDFAPVLDALADLTAAGRAADRSADQAAASGDAAAAARINGSLLQVERAFLNPEGLPKRGWFRHVLIAPGLTTGYAAWPFPGLQQAFEQKDGALFAAEARKVVAALRAGTERLRAAAAAR
jgi:N-acetylated-alpha-linked acidic dipeptidase